MTAVARLIVAAAMSVVTVTVHAQFVKGNEAVKVMPDGSKRVETPPSAQALLAKPCAISNPGCSGGSLKMVETHDGLMECTEFYARPSTCRPSTFGREKRSRVWIVKLGADWKQCERPDIGAKCVSLKSLPIAAVQ